MNDYQSEQLNTLLKVSKVMETLTQKRLADLRHMIGPYMDFRKETDAFLEEYFGGICTQNCYKNNVSACCSKDGIVTFFADHAVNALFSDRKDFTELEMRLKDLNNGFKCIYLGENGCVWKVRPIVCVMFLCDAALQEAFNGNESAKTAWQAIEEKKKEFTWPDKPVLFDTLEAIFMEMGVDSSLMYCHKSPGLIRVKKIAGRKP